MESETRIEIPRDNRNLRWLAFGAALFVGFGVWLWTLGEVEFLLGATLSAGVVQAFGAAVVAIFGAVFLYGLWLLSDNSPALIIGPEGIVDQKGVFSAGVIPWDQIEDFHIQSLAAEQIVTVELVDPDLYTNRGNPLQRFLARFQTRLYDSPIQISTQNLDVEFDELVELLEEKCRDHHAEAEEDEDWQIEKPPPREDVEPDMG